MKLTAEFFNRDVLNVAPDLIGKIIVRKFEDGSELCLRITETEAYRGEEDKACHASKGRTPRTEVMYMTAGTIYVYLIYGMYWMFNVVAEKVDVPQAVLIRCSEEYRGPGKLSKALKLDRSFNKSDICTNLSLSIIDDGYKPKILTKKRVGIDYSGEEWASKLWRFVDERFI
jgi:DNA-3-methyladenine glycosylase